MDSTITPSQDNLSALFDHHRRELVDESTIDPTVILERGYRSISRPNVNDQRSREEMRSLGFPSWAISEDYYFPALLIPMYRATGERIAAQFKPSRAVPNRDGKRMKYAAQKGRASVIDVHPRWSADRGLTDSTLVPYIRDTFTPLYITEGIKKADSLTSRGLCTIALGGVFNWRSTLGSLGDWEDIPLKGRDVTVVFDADARNNPTVLTAMQRLGRWLKSKGAKKISYLITPGVYAEKAVKGCDDFFAAGGSVETLLACATTTPPLDKISEDVFTDSKLAEVIADEILIGQYIRTSGLGWLGWNGQRWAPVDDGAIVEAVRQFVITRYMEALESERERVKAGELSDRTEIDGWHKAQSASRIKAIVSLAGNIEGVLRQAEEFDTDPDVLNTPTGVLDLATGQLFPHDPGMLCTKITNVAYRPDVVSGAFKTALEAVPDGTHTWLQKRLGQSITGYMTDDERIVLLTGGGNNGKTTLMNTFFNALGGYAAAVPNSLLLTAGKASGGATPEKMTIRGVRLAWIEETPEDRHLDTQALKEVVGTPAISGRELYKGFVTFGATHSLFLNTNHPPRVAETGHATWRRLVRIDFDTTYVLPGQTAKPGMKTRPGDPTLKAKLNTTEAKEAALAWLVAGACAWYESGRTLTGEDPAAVVAATAVWRNESDVILRFLDARCTFDYDFWVSTQSLYEQFRDWARAAGHRDMPANLFLERIKNHTGLPAYVQVKRNARRSSLPTESIPPFGRASVAAQVTAAVGLKFNTE